MSIDGRDGILRNRLVVGKQEAVLRNLGKTTVSKFGRSS